MDPSLLLVPSLSGSTSYATAKAVWGPTLAAFFTRCTATADGDTAKRSLDIAVQVDLGGISPTGHDFAKPVKVLGILYKLIASVCTESSINLQASDVRVYIIHGSSESAASPNATSSSSTHHLSATGPLVLLKQLASAQERWQGVYIPDGEPGERLFQEFKTTSPSGKSKGDTLDLKKYQLPAGVVLNDGIQSPTDGLRPVQGYSSVAVGGTFDHLHLGHRLLLTVVALLATSQEAPSNDGPRRIIVGITSDELLQKKQFSDLVEPWHQRQHGVARFLNAIANFPRPFASLQPQEVSAHGPNGHAVRYAFAGGVTVECVEIADAFGPTTTDEAIGALVVSGETRAGGRAVNEKRRELGWAELDVVEVDVLDAGADANIGAEDFQNKISSTAIRRQLAERERREAGAAGADG